MADRGREIEGVSNVILPARGWVDTVNQSCKWPLTAVGGPTAVVDRGDKLALEPSNVAVPRTYKLNIISYCINGRLREKDREIEKGERGREREGEGGRGEEGEGGGE